MLFSTYDPFSTPSTRVPFAAGRADSGALDYDVVHSEDGVTLHIDIPGIDPDTVELTVDGRSLKVEAHRDSAIPEGARIVSRRRRGDSISQTFALGDGLDSAELTAEYDLGVLTIHVPVAESAKPRRIPVGTAKSTAIDAASTS